MNKDNLETIKQFHTFYTATLAALDKKMNTELYTVKEARILQELYRVKRCHAKDLLEVSQSDKGQLSRILAKLEAHEEISIVVSPSDRRYQQVLLTNKGKELAHYINKQEEKMIAERLQHLTPHAQTELINHMQSILQLLQ